MPMMTGARLLVEMLQGYGTTHVFFVPTILMDTFALMEDHGIKPISTHGEKAAAYMADGYARVSGRPGICAAQMIGDANLMAGLKDAYMAGSPVLAITGGATPELEHRHVYQDIPNFPRFDAVTKWSAKVDQIERLPEFLRQAFRVSTSGSPGPVHLELQGVFADILSQERDLKVVIESQFAQTPPHRPEPDVKSMNEALAHLALAERPVIVAGTGVIRSGAGEALTTLAERLSIPIATSLDAKAAIPDNHPLAVGVVGGYARRCANEVVGDADLIFYVGSHTGSMVTNNWQTPAIGATTVLQLDIDPAQLGRVFPQTIGMFGDARAGLEKLNQMSVSRVNDEWIGSVQAKVKAWRQNVRSDLTSDAVPIRPERIIGELNSVLPEDAVVVSDTLQVALWTGTYLELTSPNQSYVRCAGSLGWGLPAAIGAKCAVGDRPVVCVTGDGGLYYHIAELETAARYGIPLVVVVNNNGAYAGERRFWRRLYSYDETGDEGGDMWTFGSLNFASIAAEMGCIGLRVEKPSEIGAAISEGLTNGRPTLVDVVSDPNIIGDRN